MDFVDGAKQVTPGFNPAFFLLIFASPRHSQNNLAHAFQLSFPELHLFLLDILPP